MICATCQLPIDESDLVTCRDGITVLHRHCHSEPPSIEAAIREVQAIEREAWRTVCRALHRAGVVTDADLEAPAEAEGRTTGTQVLAALREWCEARVTLEGLGRKS